MVCVGCRLNTYTYVFRSCLASRLPREVLLSTCSTGLDFKVYHSTRNRPCYLASAFLDLYLSTSPPFSPHHHFHFAMEATLPTVRAGSGSTKKVLVKENRGTYQKRMSRRNIVKEIVQDLHFCVTQKQVSRALQSLAKQAAKVLMNQNTFKLGTHFRLCRIYKPSTPPCKKVIVGKWAAIKAQPAKTIVKATPGIAMRRLVVNTNGVNSTTICS